MSKRLLVKVAVAITALSAVTLLSGCGEEDDGVVIGMAWMPVGSVSIFGFNPASSQGSTGGGGQTAAGAAAAAAGGGGGQVSGGAVQ
jgi:hypothetical protein